MHASPTWPSLLVILPPLQGRIEQQPERLGERAVRAQRWRIVAMAKGRLNGRAGSAGGELVKGWTLALW